MTLKYGFWFYVKNVFQIIYNCQFSVSFGFSLIYMACTFFQKLPFASECDLKQYQEPAVTNSLPDLSVPPPGYPKQSHRIDTQDSEVECIDDESNER